MDPVYRIKHFLALVAVGRAREVFPSVARSLLRFLTLCSVMPGTSQEGMKHARTAERALIYLFV